ncbi:gluconate kinase, SKI family [Rhizobiales bacterium GAS191]|jgi:gluconokinase|nr:gluconate kinase, SKI family [Rhizobiales bacterium GAS113]SEE11297.1 gluconate kinase, SKI family [Rhizobiales bacterium GAS191]
MPKESHTAPAVLVLMGVSGAGKTTIATLLAKRLGWPYRDADEFHPKANIDKMKSGVPLTDEDRWPWLRAIAAWIDEERANGRHAVVTCSALKRSYREIIIGDRRDVRLVFLKGDKGLLAQRLKARHGHFMPPALLKSQFDDLEEPGPAENPVTVSVDATPDEIVSHILSRLALAAQK